MSEIYYNPDVFGLTTVGEVEWSEPCYSFDLTAVWVDADKRLYWASDSGCSCPSPFEDYTSLGQLETGTFHDLARYLEERLNKEREWQDYKGKCTYADAQIVELLARARKATS